jgi:hypothetical protein
MNAHKESLTENRRLASLRGRLAAVAVIHGVLAGQAGRGRVAGHVIGLRRIGAAVNRLSAANGYGEGGMNRCPP